LRRHEGGVRLPSSDLLQAIGNALGLNAVERALLFYLYDKVEAGQSMLPYTVAVLCLDPDLRAEQVESLVHLIVQQYKDAVEANQSSIQIVTGEA